MPNKDIVPALFEGHKIRRVSDEGTIYYSAVDIIAAITNTLNPNDLWYQTKKNLSKDEIQLSNIIRRFKLQAEDGKMRLTDCLSAKNALLMIEYLHSPKAAPFRVWISQLASERMEEIQNPEKGIENSIRRWKQMGKSDPWIEARIKGMAIRKSETAVLQAHGITKPVDFAHFTDQTNLAVYGHKARAEKARRGITKSQSLRDCSTETELGLLFLHESACKEGVEKTSAYGRTQIDGVYGVVGRIIADTKHALDNAF
ncbi:MAG: hypothetical protein IIZ04_00615 [Aeriscardovia sp.]|nr:hypothetical protein [Aeriscardovia sp.]